jgi:hypothetical protein
MSAGEFTRSKYEADNGDIYAIRVQEETLLANVGAANSAPSGTIDQTLRARARKNRGALGMGARTARVRFSGQPPTGYAANSTISIPILTRSVFDQITSDQTGTYLGAAIIVVGTTGESRR